MRGRFYIFLRFFRKIRENFRNGLFIGRIVCYNIPVSNLFLTKEDGYAAKKRTVSSLPMQFYSIVPRARKLFGYEAIPAPLAKPKEKYLFVFGISFLLMAIVFLPIVIYEGGYFVYYGDFNSQQIIFYTHAHDAVRAGNTAWDWGTDLGSSFVGSYAFYLLGSPFFWLTIPFPSAAVPYLLPWLLCLKTAVAAVTSYAYIRRFVRTPNAAVIGAMLYAFSGFQAYNIFFNHFHDFTAFFPLVLLAFEQRVQENKRGVFALSIAICGIINYFFLAGVATFLILYFFVRCTDKNFLITLRKLFSLIFEALLGLGIAAFMLLPAYYAVMNNTRLDEYLYGMDMVLYSDKTRIIRIIQSFFMLPDPPARVNLFKSDYGRWASIAGYLPLFSMAGVVAFFRGKGSHWAKKLIVLCIIFAFIPVLNTSFYLFNSSYYARWYYMPILILCMMTAYVLDNKQLNLRAGVPVVAGVTAAFVVISMLPKLDDGEVVYGELAKYPDLLKIQLGVSVAMLVLLTLIVLYVKRNRLFYRIITGATAFSVVACTGAIVWYGVSQGPEPEEYISKVIEGNEKVTLPDDDTDLFFRVDSSENTDNWPVMWGYSSMRCFHSVVPASIMEFYESVGLTRDVASRIEPKYNQLRALFSVKYYFKEQKTEGAVNKTPPVTGFTYLNSQNGFDVFENQNFVPMGVAYSNYVMDDDMQSYTIEKRLTTLLHAVVLTEAQKEKYADVLVQYYEPFSSAVETFQSECEDMQNRAAYEFTESTDGFTAKIDLDRANLVFFSVPYEKGWTATVNGEPVEIEKVSYGFMAVAAPAGDNTIEFHYETAGQSTGFAIAGISVVVLLAYMLVAARVFPTAKETRTGAIYDYESVPENLPVLPEKAEQPALPEENNTPAVLPEGEDSDHASERKED